MKQVEEFKRTADLRGHDPDWHDNNHILGFMTSSLKAGLAS